jgi:ankyrin repeat protein
VNACKSEYKMTPLHNAVEAWNLDVVQLLIQRGANVNVFDYGKRTPLHYVGGVEIATLLLNAGADLEAPDCDGVTPLHKATSMYTTGVVKLLLEKGASATAINNNKMTPLHYAELKTAVGLLVKFGADINAVDIDGNSSLHHCVTKMVVRRYNFQLYVETVTALIAAGSSLTAKNNDGQTASDIAVKGELDDDILTLLKPVVIVADANITPATNTVNDSNSVNVNDSVAVNTDLHDTASVHSDYASNDERHTTDSSTAATMTSTVADATTTDISEACADTIANTIVDILDNVMVSKPDTWLHSWLHDIGFNDSDACQYAAAMTQLKCYIPKALAALKETDAVKLATKAGISEFEISMFIEGWQQLKADNQQLRVNTSISLVNSAQASPLSASSSRPQSPVALITDPSLRYTERQLLTGHQSGLSIIYKAIDQNTKRAVVLKCSPINMELAFQVTYYRYCFILHMNMHVLTA